MIVKSKLEFKDYYKLMLGIAFKKVSTILITLLGLIMFGGPLLYYLGLVDLVDAKSVIRLLPDSRQEAFGRLMISFFMLLATPVSVYSRMKAYFESHPKISETINYEFSAEEIKVNGETFYYQSDWSKTYKLKEVRNWLLLYPDKKTIIPISKSNLSAIDITRLRDLLRNVNDTIIELKS